ncbi:MAG: hypothetical protein AAF621_05105 [Pseudomonadota bacterium]
MNSSYDDYGNNRAIDWQTPLLSVLGGIGASAAAATYAIRRHHIAAEAAKKNTPSIATQLMKGVRDIAGTGVLAASVVGACTLATKKDAREKLINFFNGSRITEAAEQTSRIVTNNVGQAAQAVASNTGQATQTVVDNAGQAAQVVANVANNSEQAARSSTYKKAAAATGIGTIGALGGLSYFVNPLFGIVPAGLGTARYLHSLGAKKVREGICHNFYGAVHKGADALNSAWNFAGTVPSATWDWFLWKNL